MEAHTRDPFNFYKFLLRALESKKPTQEPYSRYRKMVHDHYDGLAGELTSVSGVLSGHATLARAIIRPEGFDVRGCKRILDAGCGNGRYSKCILEQADPEARVVGVDFSRRMLARARRSLDPARAYHAAADLTRLPFADGFFDAAVCGWVLEHLPEPEPGLAELARVLVPGGKLLLLTTEATLTGSLCSSLWHCRTYNRGELAEVARGVGLEEVRPLYFSRMHKLFGLGGIIVELRKKA